MTSTEEERQREEYLKLSYDLSKHLTTLSTAAALVIIGLFRDDFGLLLYIVLVLLGLSVFFAVFVMSWAVWTIRPVKPDLSPPMWLYAAKVMMVGTLAIALVLFGIYVFR